MAGDWLPMRLDLPDDPAVITMACALNLDTDTVVGKLFRFWVWANKHTKDGNAGSVTRKWLDAYMAVTGWSDTMIAVGWLLAVGDGFSITNFDRWNSQSAKGRILTTRRVQEFRKRNCNADAVNKTFPEKRREEYNTPLPPKGENGVATRPKQGGKIKITAATLGHDLMLAAVAERASAAGWVSPGRDGLLQTFQFAAHALRIGKNPEALFISMLRGGLHHEKISSADEDQARRRLAAFEGQPPLTPSHEPLTE